MPLRICQALMLPLASDSDPDIVKPGEDRVDRVGLEQQTVGQAVVRRIVHVFSEPADSSRFAEAMMCVQVPIRSWCRLLLWSMASAPSLLTARRANSVVLVGFLGAGRIQRDRHPRTCRERRWTGSTIGKRCGSPPKRCLSSMWFGYDARMALYEQKSAYTR